MIRKVPRWFETALPSAALGAALIAALAVTLPGAPVASQPSSAVSIAVSGHHISTVHLSGRSMTLSTFLNRYWYGSHTASLMVDHSAIKRGYFMAFTSTRQEQRYLRSHHMGSLQASDTNADRGNAIRTRELREVKGGNMQFVTCTLPSYYAFFYKNVSCGGSYISMVNNDYIANFGTYGMNDAVSSIAVGCKIADVTTYKDANKGGSHINFGGDDVYTSMPLGWNDVISSATTNSSGAC